MSLSENGTIHHHRAQPRSVFDVSGAGDTALAALAMAVAAGLPLIDAIALADLAAGTAVGKAGTATVSPEELLDAALPGTGDIDWRVLSRDKAASTVASWHRDGLKVGFTNGCFDILHPGHLASLRHGIASPMTGSVPVRARPHAVQAHCTGWPTGTRSATAR